MRAELNKTFILIIKLIVRYKVVGAKSFFALLNCVVQFTRNYLSMKTFSVLYSDICCL